MLCLFLELIAGPELSPITVVEVKEYLGIDNNNEDSLIDSYIKAATTAIENITGRSLIIQSWRQLFMKADLPLVLLKRPVQEIIEIRYLENRSEVIWDLENYNLLGFKIEAEQLPSEYIYVDYRSGYGDTPKNVPEDIKQVIKLLVAYWYENRNQIGEISDGFKELLSSYRTIAY